MHSLKIWTLAENRARKFFEDLGGILVGSMTTHVGGLSVEGVAYAWTDTAILLP
jgi:hypothetical protein